VTGGHDWEVPRPGRAAPTASTTLTQEAASRATNQLDLDVDRDHDGKPDRVDEHREHKTVLELLGEIVELDPQLVEESQPSRAASPQAALHPQSEDPDAHHPLRLGEDSAEQGAVPSFLGSLTSSQLEFGQTGGEIRSSEARVGRAASPSEGTGVQVAFPRRPWPAAAALATRKVDPHSGSDSESVCTEVSASFEVAPVESGESDPLHSHRHGHLLPVALPRLTTTDSKLEVESDSDDDCKSGAHFWPFVLLRLIPTDETDAEVHPDGDDQAAALGRPEWGFAWS
jgi:hypothetical protein